MSSHVVARMPATGSISVLALLHASRPAFPRPFSQLRGLSTLGSITAHIRWSLESNARSIRATRLPFSSAIQNHARWAHTPGNVVGNSSRSRGSAEVFKPSKHLSTTPISSSLVRSRARRCFNTRRQKSSSSRTSNTSAASANTRTEPAKATTKSSTNTESSSRSFYDRLPHMPQYHRPTKEELLAAATGFWSRLKVRFKWLTIRSARPFNSDEIGALFSWVIFGHLLWIILGTTTFFSLAILTVNTVFAQETLARWVGNYLTKSSGMKVVFESAIVPRWRDGVITFKNVFISRRPGQGSGKVSKGSPQTAAAAAAASIAAERDSTSEEAEDTNYTQFDMTLDTVNVTLSFTKWFNGQGPLNDVEIKGVRGVIDRTSVHSTGQHVDPKTYRHVHHPGDFEIEHFKMEDFLVTVHQPGGFRPFSVSIFSCDLPQLRQRWLFYDFLCANTVSGSFDDSLFTIHPRQMLGHPNAHLARDEESGESDSPWKKHSRLRIDALKIDHLNRGTDGPFSWIHEGTVDLIADVMFPTEADDGIITKLMSEIKGVKALGEKLLDDATIHNDPKSELSVPATVATPVKSGEDKKFLVLDLKVNFHDVRAAVPLLTTDLSYVNYALIRPIVAYINSRKTFIPINCRVIKRADDFDGSWTLYDSGLLDDLSAETYTAIVKDITDDQARMRRFKKVGLWSLQLAVQALFMGMAGNLA